MKALFLASAILFAATAPAQLFPGVPTKGTVYDGAGLLTPDDEAKIDALSRDFRRDTGAPIVVATLPSLASVGAASMGIEKYGTALFNQWRIGRNDANGGILLLVSKADRKVRIELGKDWKHDYDAGAHTIVQGTIVPAFKKGDFSGGIVRGCQALSHLADAPNAAPASPAVAAPDNIVMGDEPNASSGFDGGFPFMGLFCCAAPIFAFVAIVASVRRQIRGGIGRPYGGSFGNGPQGSYIDQNTGDDGAFLAGMMTGQAMSQPTYDPGPSFDPGPSSDGGSSFDSGGSSDSGGSFDSGSSGGGGDTGSW